MTATRTLARFAAALGWRALPPPVQAEARRALLNWFGCAIGGASEATYAALHGTLGTPGGAWLAARADRVEAGAAAVLNGFAASHYCYDDTHLETVIHPTAPVVAAALAAAASRPVDGATLLAALVAGNEVACRVGRALMTGPHPASLGWYMTGVAGTLGAAASAGRMLGLDEDMMVAALGLAASQAGGLRAAHASATSPLVPGLAARNGYTAAVLARAGLSCHDGALEGPKGLLGCFAPGNPAAPLVEALGDAFSFLDLTYKPYPCGIVVHPAIDGCLAILAENPRPTPEAIARIEVTVDPVAALLCLRESVETVFDAQVSIPHWCAAAFVAGEAGLAQARQSCVDDPAVRALRRRFLATTDPSLAPDQARVAVLLSDGRRLAAEVAHATGSLANPLGEAALRRKARDQMAAVLGDAQASRLLDRLDDVAALPDLAALLDAASPG
jgi:2-methylcitrate dehydratase PrpD